MSYLYDHRKTHELDLVRGYQALNQPVPQLDSAWGRNLGSFHDFVSRTLGIRYFSATELCTPHQPQQTGMKWLIPPKHLWLWSGPVLLMADRLRQIADAPLHARNHYRPPMYNRRVGGSPNSDHLSATAVDLDITGSRSRAQQIRFMLEGYLRGWSDQHPGLLRMGLGLRSIHVSILSHRRVLGHATKNVWTYPRGPVREVK